MVNFFRNLAQPDPNDPGKNRIIEIRPYKAYKGGFAYKIDTETHYLDYFPEMDNPRGEQAFILDGDNLIQFGDMYKKILGGLLLDHQSFLVSEIDSQGNVIRRLCAFSLLGGALTEDYFKSQGTRPSEAVYAPILPDNSFDANLYEESNLYSIVSVMNAFKDIRVGYRRIGGSNALDRQREEYPVWMATCGSLHYISSAFKM